MQISFHALQWRSQIDQDKVKFLGYYQVIPFQENECKGDRAEEMKEK